MKAVYIEAHCGLEVLTYGERPEPVIEPYEVKVRVRACSLNRLDLYTRAGAQGTRREFHPPLVQGLSLSEVLQHGERGGSQQAGVHR